MSDPFIAEIQIFGCNFAPRGWAFCNGQLLPIAQNTALFSLIGTTYGGDGESTTGLPDLQGRFPMHPGQGPGLDRRRLGERTGTATAALTSAHLPAHAHGAQASDEDASTDDPSGARLAPQRDDAYATAIPVSMAAGRITETGGGQPHDNVHPYLTLNFCIALVGTYPSRS